MKRLFSFLSMAVAAMTIIGCQEKEIETYEPIPNEGSTFELFADIVQTKTTLDGYDVEWDADDVLYMVTPGNDAWSTAQSFTYADGKFVTESTLTEGEYTINAIYCTESQSVYHKNGGTTHNLSAVQSQSGATTDHIQNYDALVGTFNVNVPMSEPAVVEMAHLYTMMEVNVNNNTGEEIEIAQFEMTATDANLAGIFTVTAFDEPSVELKSSASETITVSVSGEATVADKESFPVYFVMAPLEEYSGKITFKVSTTDGKTYTKTMTVDEGKTLNFAAGTYNRTGYTIETADENAQSLPWSEDFSGDISQYVLVDGGSTTKIYAGDALAGGEAPELLVSKSGGSFTARVSSGDYVGSLTLTFKSNYPGYLEVTTATDGVTVEKNNDSEYIIAVTEAQKVFSLTFTNNKSSNARLDDISLVKGVREEQNLVFDVEEFNLVLNSDEFTAFSGQEVKGAMTAVTYTTDNSNIATVISETGEVKLTGQAGRALITATAAESADYKQASKSYAITVIDASVKTEIASLSFAEVSNRISQDESAQVWCQNEITFTNNKSSSTTNVSNNYNPVRLYKYSEIIVSREEKMTQIVFNCNSASYATALKNSIGANATASDKVVTVVLPEAASTFTASLTGGQVRLDNLTVTYIVE